MKNINYLLYTILTVVCMFNLAAYGTPAPTAESKQPQEGLTAPQTIIELGAFNGLTSLKILGLGNAVVPEGAFEALADTLEELYLDPKTTVPADEVAKLKNRKRDIRKNEELTPEERDLIQDFLRGKAEVIVRANILA